MNSSFLFTSFVPSRLPRNLSEAVRSSKDTAGSSTADFRRTGRAGRVGGWLTRVLHIPVMPASGGERKGKVIVIRGMEERSGVRATRLQFFTALEH